MKVAFRVEALRTEPRDWGEHFVSFTTFAEVSEYGDVTHPNVFVSIALQNLWKALQDEMGMAVRP